MERKIMSFEQFAEKYEAGTLDQDIPSEDNKEGSEIAPEEEEEGSEEEDGGAESVMTDETDDEMEDENEETEGSSEIEPVEGTDNEEEEYEEEEYTPENEVEAEIGIEDVVPEEVTGDDGLLQYDENGNYIDNETEEIENGEVDVEVEEVEDFAPEEEIMADTETDEETDEETDDEIEEVEETEADVEEEEEIEETEAEEILNPEFDKFFN